MWRQGERFGTIGCRIGDREFEITTHRAEAYSPDSRKPEVEFADAIEADLARRDFTVNAMALEVPEPTLVDPFDGAADLAAGRLRTPLAPEESFSDDPLRMLRAARFISGYGLAPDDGLVAAVHEMGGRLEIVSAERIRDELDKLIVVDDPAPGLWFLVDTGLAEHFLPELPQMRLEQDPIHRHKDVLAHTIAVVGNVSPRKPDGSSNRITRLAALFHDVGKPKTRSYAKGVGVTFHHHEVVGRPHDARPHAGAALLERGRRAGHAARVPAPAVPHVPAGVDRQRGAPLRARRRGPARRARRAHPLGLHHPQRAQGPHAAQPHGRARGAHRGPRGAGGARRHPARPRRHGGHGAARRAARPVVGQALAFLLELRLDEGPLDPEEAGRRLDAWWAERSG